MSGIYLLLGSNLGHKAKHIQIAKEYLTARMIIVKKESQIYETAAWGKENQASFYNQVIEVDQPFTPQKLLEIVLEIEAEMGRVRDEQWGERLIDIDILYFGDKQLQEDDLTIPHPQIQNRKFTLSPLAEIAPDFVHPTLGASNLTLLEKTKDKLSVEVIDL